MTLVSPQTEARVNWWMALLSTYLEVVPCDADWRNANKLFGHPRGCQCSTCDLAATMAGRIRFLEQFPHDQA